MRYLLTILIIACLGCIEPVPPKPVRLPQRTTQPVHYGEIALITRDNCIWCERQKATLSKMNLAGWKLVVIDHSAVPSYRDMYPVNAYPTLMITTTNGTRKIEGYQDEGQLNEILGR